ncbi:adenylate kinase [Kineococcus radiotolerans]|uniref:Adenylate kinase n=1 Tax=Kineococcus radiotolerans (strain ATCC BAA-149 / DSM 14245 / SRS30216) TaxID=266940 RepID=A6W5V9_KINRD|nr:adenylate kinase [Kineococcus radiotolerans]ABS02198.1 adenylate kinase [Kineococcus radiotolerans SRS30216 = ATCC BAA-149]
MTRLVLLGPPGAGKGTQAKLLSDRLGVPAISTGDIFRANVAEGTELGRTVQEYLNAGKYVPDAVTNQMVRERLAQPDAAEGFILDGYPRTTDQVRELDDMLADVGAKLEHVLEIAADTDELVRRLAKRAVEQGRSDDTEEVIRTRQQVYAEQTAPLVEVYSDRGLLRSVDGLGDIPEVTSRLVSALGLQTA